jgi:hypothetical protein
LESFVHHWLSVNRYVHHFAFADLFAYYHGHLFSGNALSKSSLERVTKTALNVVKYFFRFKAELSESDFLRAL